MTERDFASLLHCGITREIAEAAKLRRVESHEGGELVGRNGTGDYEGIVYPNTWPGDSHARENRLRLDRPPLEQGSDGTLTEGQKYLAPPGRGNLLYFGPDVPPASLTDTTLPIVITEGEKKTLALTCVAWHGLGDAAEKPRFLPIGLTGVWNWRGKTGRAVGPDGEWRDVKGVISDFDKIEWKGRHVTIVFDADVDTNDSVRDARKRLAEVLRQRGAIVHLFNWPAIIPAGVKGIDDLIGRWGPDPVLALLEKTDEKKPSTRTIEVLSVSDFIKKEIPNREPIIEGVLYPKSRNGVTGPGKALKSMFIQNLKLSLAAGLDFLGFAVPKPRRAAYLQWEVSELAMQGRLARMTVGRPGHDFGNAFIANAHGLKIDTPEGYSEIERIIERSRAEVVIFDPLYKLHRKDENKAQEMGEVVDLFDRLIESHGVAIIAVHHHGKSAEGKDDGQLARGSTVFGDWVDTQLVIRGTNEGRYQKRLSFVLRNDAEPEPMQIILDPETLWFRAATEQEANPGKVLEAERVRDAAQQLFSDGKDVDAEAIKVVLGVSLNTGKSRLRMLERFGWEETKGRFGKKVYRPKGCQTGTFDTL